MALVPRLLKDKAERLCPVCSIRHANPMKMCPGNLNNDREMLEETQDEMIERLGLQACVRAMVERIGEIAKTTRGDLLWYN